MCIKKIYIFWTKIRTGAKPWWPLRRDIYIYLFLYKPNLTTLGYQVLFRTYYSNAKNTTAS